MVETTTQYRNFDTGNVYDTVNWRVSCAQVYGLSRNTMRTIWSHVTWYQFIRSSHLRKKSMFRFTHPFRFTLLSPTCFVFWPVCINIQTGGWILPSKFIRRGTKATDDKNTIHTASYDANEIYMYQVLFNTTIGTFVSSYKLWGVVSPPKYANGPK